jgi:hypothetical protein
MTLDDAPAIQVKAKVKLAQFLYDLEVFNCRALTIQQKLQSLDFLDLLR